MKSIFYVKYSDGSVVTKEQEDAIRKHEFGHRDDHARIVPTKQTTHNVSMIVCENEMKAKWKEWMAKLGEPIVNEYKKKIAETQVTHGTDIRHSLFIFYSFICGRRKFL